MTKFISKTHLFFLSLYVSTSFATSTVTTSKLKDVVFYPVTSIPGTVVALSDSNISSDINGRIKSLNYEIGVEAKSNSILAEIECSDYMALKDQAESNLDAVKAQNEFTKWKLDRAEKLLKQQNISEEEVEKLKSSLIEINANIDRNMAALNNAQTQVNRCKIRAPFDGVVTKKYASLGEYAHPGTQIYRLLDVHNLEIEAEIHRDEIPSINKSHEISFSLSKDSYPAQIRTILPQQNNSTKMHTIRLKFIGSAPVAGSTGRLEWKDNSPHIPVEFIQHIGNDYGVFIVDQTKEGQYKAKFHKLPNVIEGQAAKINLPENTLIVVKGRERLTNNDIVKSITDPDEK